MDLGFSGPKYTWSNNRQDSSRIRERLDRGISKLSWNNLFPEANVSNLIRTSFDHSLILLNTSNPNYSPKSFKFEEFWTYDPTNHGKLKAPKTTFKLWNQISFGNIPNEIKKLNQAPHKIQTQEPSQIPDNLENDLKEQLNEMLKKEESLWIQKSRITWLTTTDLNTKFFHTSTIVRCRRNNIESLKIGNGNDLKTLFPTKISDTKNAFLCKSPDDMEISKTYWEVIKPDLVATSKSFFISGKLLKELNYTNITLVPKKDSPNVHHFRPIGLSNVCYKFIEKF
ncbi:hypothetical protein CIPAW_09G198500 [Carya illinoinensis]|uniref:Uncharacterized protein n=1 Tax=Carya illinoinensis TaxID=32201 RepID=A0A8T1PQI9_CARIL|nr:hypothetical protein CIPAW_09G198500 [Carya illinoinensis]